MSSKPIRAALYLRVSTDGQTVENQRAALEAVAAQRGWRIVATYDDAGISGAKGRDKRPGLDGMLKAAGRANFDVVMAWAVDRLGRSLADLLATLKELDASHVDLFLHQQNLDTTTPSGRAMFGLLGVFAEFERGMIQSRVKAGLKRVRDAGGILGRPKINGATLRAVQAALLEGKGINKVAGQCGVGNAAVARIKAEMAASGA